MSRRSEAWRWSYDEDGWRWRPLLARDRVLVESSAGYVGATPRDVDQVMAGGLGAFVGTGCHAFIAPRDGLFPAMLICRNAKQARRLDRGLSV